MIKNSFSANKGAFILEFPNFPQLGKVNIPVDVVHKIKTAKQKIILNQVSIIWSNDNEIITFKKDDYILNLESEYYHDFFRVILSIKNLTLSDDGNLIVIGHQIGHGKFGKVYTIRYPKSYKDKAIKYISQPNKYTLKECNIHRSICRNQVNIVLFYKMLKDRYIMIELCRSDIKEYYTENNNLREMKNHLLQIANQLQYIHDNGIVHCDIKSGNILVGYDNKAKITDFGLALKSNEFYQMNRGLRGTPTHMAPEILNININSRDFYKIDVWAYAIMVYKLIFKRNPFYASGSRDDLFKSIKEDHYKVTKHDTKHISEYEYAILIDLLDGCLTKDPSQRFNMQDIADHEWFDNVK